MFRVAAPPMKSGAGPSRASTPRAQATRQRVLRVARDHVAEVGALNISTNEIARRASVSWGVIQYHFGTRAGLLVALVEESFAALRGRLEVLDPSGMSLDARLAAIVDAAWGYYTQPEYLMTMDIVRALHGDGEARAPLDRLLRRSEVDVARLWNVLIEPCLPPGGRAGRSVQTLVFASVRGLAISRSLRRGTCIEERDLLVRALSGLLEAT